MAKDFWLSLPVKDIRKSREFFTRLGFQFNDQYKSDNSACLLVGEKKVVVMLFEEPAFKGFISRDICDTQQGTEVLLSFDAKSKEEVDQLVEKVIAAGGKSNHKPSEMTGWMYGCVFSDIDGHRWNILHMDMSRQPE
ncbi:MAG: VOC family protein [Bacteroidetes bacterium]|nr:VOC family protein [Bacteroidota bacterium]